MNAARPVASVVFLSLVASAPGQNAVPMSRLAPADSFMVAEVPSVTTLREVAEGSALGDLWRDERVRAFVEHLAKDNLEQMAAQLAKIDAKPEDLSPPAGRVGAALFMPKEAPGGGEAFPTPHFLIVADFGENAADWRDLIERELARAKGEAEIEFHEEDRDGVTITVVRDIQEPAGDEADPGMAEEPEAPQEFFLAWAGNNLAFTTHRPAMEGALDGLSGREIDSVHDDDTFNRSLRQHAPDPLAYAVVLVAPLAERFRESFQDDMLLPGDPAPLFEALGLDQVRSLSFALRSVGGPESLAELSGAALVPEKNGLVELFTRPLGALEPSRFVGADTSTFTAFSFRFEGLLEVIRDAINALPEEQRAPMQAGFENGAATFAPALAQLGPKVEYFTSYERPLSPESQHQVFAIQVRDPLPVSNTLATVLGPMGMKARDFEGNAIYSSDFLPFSVGLGFGALFIGPTPGVEDSMRAAGNPDAARLATEARFRKAGSRVSPEAVMSSFSDLRQEIQWAYYMFQHMEEIRAASLDGFDIPAEQKEEMLRSMREEDPVPEWVQHLPPIEVFTSRLGFSIYDLRPTPEGFVGHSRLLKAD